jgi:uncharacterized linocin/CFP29 family protein
MEYAKRKTNIYVPSQWDTIASVARRGNAYTVISVRHPDIVDFKKVHKDHYRNVTCDIKNNKIIWNKVKHIQLRKEKPGSMFVKYDFSQEFMEIEYTPKTRGNQKK